MQESIPKRNRGAKLPKNRVKMEIILLLRDGSKTTSEIRDYLREKYCISESRGIRLHLEHLCQKEILEKDVQNGVGTNYFWKRNPDSFRKIINTISDNNETVREILKHKKINLQSRYNIELKKRMADKVSFDATSLWYNTEYAKLFITETTLEYFIDVAYQKCNHEQLFLNYCKSVESSSTLELFRLVFLENNDNETLLLLMRYSPSLVQYIVNLEENCMKRLGSLDQRKDLIFQMIVKYNLMSYYTPHGGGLFPVADIKKITDRKGKIQRVDAKISYSFYPEHGDQIGFLKPKKVKTGKNVK